MSARPGLCGGRSAMIVPTAIANGFRFDTLEFVDIEIESSSM